MIRYAIVTAATGSLDPIAAYMPGNYRVVATFAPGELDDVLAEYQPFTEHTHLGYSSRWAWAVIEGKDDAGWTLDGYVIPRLGSGNYPAVEIDLSHPVMKRVPVEKRTPYYGPLCPALLSRAHPAGRGRPTADGVCEDCGQPIAVSDPEPQRSINELRARGMLSEEA